MSLSRISLPSNRRGILLVMAALFVLSGTLSSATLVPTGTVFTPAPPLIAGSGQYAVSSLTIIPSGATTFSRYYTLQMQTGLLDARWNIQVLANGVPAAQQSASGTTAFINGYLLSYPTTTDLSFTVAINGTVPAGGVSDITVLQITELDNSGAPVPGGSIMVTAPLAPVPPQTSSLPPGPGTPVPSSGQVSVQQTAHTPGFSVGEGIGGSVLGILVFVVFLRQHSG